MSVVTERMVGAIRRDDGNPLTVLYGEATGGSFIGRDLVVRTIEEELLEHLRAMGFERIIFSSRSRRLAYARDRRSHELTRFTSPGETGSAGTTFRHFRNHSRLGNRRQSFSRPTQTAPQNLEQLNNQSLAMIIGTLNRWVRDTTHRTVLVILNAESWFEFADAPEALADAIRNWERPDHGNHNRVIMVYGVGTTGELEEQARRVGAGELRAFILNQTRGDRVPWDRAVLSVDVPHEDEFDRLLQLVRVQFQLDAEWTDLRAPGGRHKLAAQMMGDTPRKSIDKWYRQLAVRQPELSIMSFRNGENPLIYQGNVDTRTAQERLDEMAGLDEIKALLKAIVSDAKDREALLALGQDVPSSTNHMIFQGNPGTGKTEVAMLVGEILRDAGVLHRGHTQVVDAATLVAGYVGQTFGQVDAAVDQAIDGVLFIDEAYQLSDNEDGANAFGKQAIDTLVRRMDAERDRLVVIAAGYPGKMHDFVAANPGLQSRFRNIVNFPDYKPEVLLNILLGFLEDVHIPCSEEAKVTLLDVITGMHRARTEGFGNAREMRNLRDSLKLRRALRRQANSLPLDTPLLPEDLPKEYETYLTRAVPPIEELLQELNQLEGLAEVKNTVRALVDRIIYQRRRGGGAELVAENLVFLGPPGTGKTTVALLMGRIYQALGLLPRADVTEVGRADLVGQYLGTTAPKTKAALDRAMGGVLFIDEVYALSQGDHDQYGTEAIDTLTPEILNRRGKMAVIVAGYTEPTQRFLRVNDGLQSRFDREITFASYSDDELMAIFRRRLVNLKFTVGEGVEERVRHTLSAWRTADGQRFGNARSLDRLLRRMEAALAARVNMQPENADREFLSRFEVEDVPDVATLG